MQTQELAAATQEEVVVVTQEVAVVKQTKPESTAAEQEKPSQQSKPGIVHVSATNKAHSKGSSNAKMDDFGNNPSRTADTAKTHKSKEFHTAN